MHDKDLGGMSRLRKEAMQEMMQNLYGEGHHNNTSLSYVRQAIERRANTLLYKTGYDNRSNQHHRYCSITSCNMRGIKNKLNSLNGIDFWSYNKEVGSQFICIQDHHLLNKQSPRMIASAGRVIPDMEHGSYVSQQSTSFTSKGELRVGGVAALTGGILHRYRSKQIQDKRHWGRYVGRIIRGQSREQQTGQKRQHKESTRHTKFTNLAIITVYAAVESTSPNSMWQQQCTGILGLERAERQMKTKAGVQVPDPHAQLRSDLGIVIERLKQKEKCNVILMGDFNINLHKNTTEARNLIDWANDAGLYNPYMENFGSTLPNQHAYISSDANSGDRIDTWAQSDKTPEDERKEIPHGHLDHVWASADLRRRNCIPSYTVPQYSIANTDHRPVTITLDIAEALGIDTRNYATTSLKRRVLMFKNKKQTAAYSEHLTKHIDNGDLRQMVRDALSDRSNATQRQVDDIMRKLVAAFMHAEQAIDLTPESNANRKFRHGYSYEMVQRVRALSACKGLLKEARQHDKRNAVSTYKLIAVKYTDLLNIPRCPLRSSPPSHWHSWSKQVEQCIYDLRKSLHHKNVLDMRRTSNENAAKIEAAEPIARTDKHTTKLSTKI